MFIMIKDYLSLIRFEKPIGTLLLLWPTLGALVVASGGTPPVYAVLVFSLGVFLTRSAGCAVNDMADADFDKNVERTKLRPVADGRISKTKALLFAAVLSLLALVLACKFLHNKYTMLLTLPALLIFASYPYMKRFFPVPQAYLGVAFSFGILMAFVEITGKVNFTAWLLFLANLCWVLGYDTIYAMVDIKDDLKIGIKTSAITMGKFVIPFISLCYTLFFIIFFGLGHVLHLNVAFYLCLSLAGGLLVYQVVFLLHKDEQRYFRLFLLNNWVGLGVFLGLVIGHIR